MAGRAVVDPAGVSWSVRRRWYPWRRALSFRDALADTPADTPAEPAPDANAEPETSDDHHLVVQILLGALGLVLWVVIGVGRILVYAGAIALFVVISIGELAIELIVMPVVVLLRVVGVLRWPVQINRAGKHVETRHAADYSAAATVRDEAAAAIERGELGGVPAA